MAYIGAPPLNRVLSSADIAQGAVTLDDINFTDQPTNMDITGTIDKHTMRLADGVTITGDVTISDDLVLSKISDDGNAITMTNDGSSRTITGSGSIEASTLSQTPNQSLTGMTGTLGSAVVGSPALNLTTTTSFPAGHVVNVSYSGRIPTASLGTQSSDAHVVGSFQPTLASASNKVLVMMDVHVYKSSTTITDVFAVELRGGGITTVDKRLHNNYGYNWTQYQRHQLVASTLDSAPSSTTPTYELYQGTPGGSPNPGWDCLSFVCMEIQG